MKRGKSRESSAAANKKPRMNPAAAPPPPPADNTGIHRFLLFTKTCLNNIK